MRTHIHPFGVRRNHLHHLGQPARHQRARRGAIALALTATLGVTLAACGDDSDSGSNPSSSAQTASNGDVFNDADVQFATDMIPHHAQALAMVDMTAGRPLDPEVQQLTDQIRAAQGPEIETMTDWLTAWGEKVPETMRDHANAGHDMGDDESGKGKDLDMDSDMPGMMSAEQLDELHHASDAEFQDMWLQMMVEHHQGAIEMAQDEQDSGTFDDARAMAKNIESSQQQEIDQMEDLLG